MTQKELGYVELEWTCKHCGTKNPGLQRTCTSCGAPISKDENYELPDQQALITDQQKLDEAKKGPAIYCPYCNTLNAANAKLCIQCGGDIQAGLARQAGQVLGAHDTSIAPDKPCPSCGQMVKANAQRCPNCGGSLVTAATQTPVVSSTQSAPKKMPIWLILGGVGVLLLCIVGVIAFAVLSSRTNEVTASVADMHWEYSVAILAQQPAKKGAWEEDVPSEASNVSCEDKYKETSSNPAPNSTEVCGTSYVVDQGSGAGKVVQDCEYRVYASYCSYSVLEWTVVDTASAMGSNTNTQWPSVSLQAGQKEGERNEIYKVSFESGSKTYAYSPADLQEFSQFSLGSQWVLSVNSFGTIKELHQK